MKRFVAMTLLFAACGGEKRAPQDSAATTPAPAPSPTANAPISSPTPDTEGVKVTPKHSPELASVEGRLAMVGPDPMSYLAIIAPGNRQTRIEGPLEPEMRGSAGTYIWAEGKRSATGFVPRVFEVRRAAEQVVDDGIVVVSGGAVSIRMRSGAIREVPNPPTAMREMAGARIWVTKPVAGQAPTYGVIMRAPR
jgi:hypothetical protein